jgi:signal peptidase I
MAKKKNAIFYKVISTSMCPSLNVGDVVVRGRKTPEEINVGERDGDILILKGPQYFYEHGVDPIMWNFLRKDTPIIHRAIDKKKVGETWYFKTKGDNSWAPDGSFRVLEKTEEYILTEYNKSNELYVPESEVLGVVVKKFPLIDVKPQISVANTDSIFNLDWLERLEAKIFVNNKKLTKNDIKLLKNQ